MTYKQKDLIFFQITPPKIEKTNLEKEQLLLGAPEERVFEHAGGGGS